MIDLVKSNLVCCRQSQWKWPRPAISPPPWKLFFVEFARRRDGNGPGLQLHMVESVPSITGAMAGDRLVAEASRMPGLAQALASKAGVAGAAMPDLTPVEREWIDRAATACQSAQGRALIVANAFGDGATASWVARTNEALGASSLLIKVTPVTLPPGRLRLATNPAATGSTPIVKTIGMVWVAAIAARTPTVPPVKIRPTLRPTRSAAIIGSESK